MPKPALSPASLMFLGVRIDRLEARDLVERVTEAIRSGSKLIVTYYGFHTSNCLRDSPGSRTAFSSFSIVVPDGIAVIFASPLFGPRLRMQNRISDQFSNNLLFPLAATRGWRVFLLGADLSTISVAAARLRARFPDLEMVGVRDGYFPPEDSEMVIAEINSSRADLLVVGMGQPKQEEWIVLHADAIKVPVIWAVGGYFDHLARRADCYPSIVYRLRLNWLYRLLTEPRRLWRRYLCGFPLYLMRVAKYAAGGGRRHRT